jgi:hypothetical protein
MSKPSYGTYVKDRLSGFEGPPVMPRNAELEEYPEIIQRTMTSSGRRSGSSWRPRATATCAVRSDGLLLVRLDVGDNAAPRGTVVRHRDEGLGVVHLGLTPTSLTPALD